MSIIHDALKKVQESTRPEQLKPASAPTAPAVEKSQAEKPPAKSFAEKISSQPAVQATPSADTTEPRSFLGIALIAVVTVIVLVIMVVLFRLARETTQHPTLNVTISTVATDAATSNDLASLIRVQGIMNQGGKTVALINDGIYEEGQPIFGRAILRISLNQVTIMDNGVRRDFPVDSARK
ncbi:MAG: hypothetical protein HGA80_03030 [Candidatus Omnitrophica bacterium]|nr:hypothetical protein [Candidatus Omnitrophota bacterium]